jgi:hypothetical protein
LTSRGRAALVLAFVASGALCAGAAVALVKASDDSGSSPRLSLPASHPTLVPGETTSPEPTATDAPTGAPTPTASAAPSLSASASPKPAPTRTTTRVTRTPAPQASQEPEAQQAGLAADATLDPASGGTTADAYRVAVHATDDASAISKATIDWGDGTSQALTGTACAHPAGADCRNFTSAAHHYGTAGDHHISVSITAGDRTVLLLLTAHVTPAASPSPTQAS